MAAILLAMAVGCQEGSEGIEVQGRLLEGGAPASLENYEEGYNFYEVMFRPVGEGTGVTQNVLQDGTFELRDIAPGEYRVGVAKMITGEEGLDDEWEGKFSPENSSMTIQVTAGQDITIDLDDIRGGGGSQAPAAEEDAS